MYSVLIDRSHIHDLSFCFYCRHPGCDCPDGWTGYHCEKRTFNVDQQTSVCTLGGDESDNSSHTCQNGGTCKSLVVRGYE